MNEWATRSHKPDVLLIETRRLTFEATGDYFDPGFAQCCKASPIHLRVRIDDRSDDTSNSRIEQRLDARWSAFAIASVATRLEVHIDRRSLGSRTCFFESPDFGVLDIEESVIPASNNLAILDYDRAYKRIGTDK